MEKQRKSFILLATFGVLMMVVISLTFISATNRKPLEKSTTPDIETTAEKPKGCVFKTTFEGEILDSALFYKAPEKVLTSVESALSYLAEAQHPDGGWGAGFHNNQQEMNPHKVKPDPATTSMVSMAILRSGTTLNEGVYSRQLNKAVHFLITEVENSNNNNVTITDLTGTQIQTKLGSNIDVILTAQFFTNLLDYPIDEQGLEQQVRDCLDKCVIKIQKVQAGDGSIKGSGWAGVLQSSFANNALEAAQMKGAKVNEQALEKSREYQKSNFDHETGDVNTDMGAGIVLYSVSSSTRASAKEARHVEEKVKKAKEEGKLEKEAEITTENLKAIGYEDEEALKYSTSYNVYKSAKNVSQKSEVMTGFGNNGGEEFLSFLQTGESMIIGKDSEWKKWYDNVSGTLLGIQNNDGSWNGHHCITSPVFCTATSVLILTVNNDIDKLVALGGS